MTPTAAHASRSASLADVLLPRVSVLDSHLAYREAAGNHESAVALFLHGNPTSSYIWRHVIDQVAPMIRCIAPDLIGFGQSGKPDIAYDFADHAAYLDAFIDALGIDEIYLVAQDWGTALAFDLANRRPELVRGMAFMEFIRPLDTWAQFHTNERARAMFQRLRTPGVGERLVLEENVFVERILPGSVARSLDTAELDVYRAPFVAVSSRLPMLQLPRQLPIEGEPPEVARRLSLALAALRSSTYPKLLFVGDPGALVTPSEGDAFAATLHSCDVVHLRSGSHYLQEDHPGTIGRHIAEWIQRVSRE